MTKTEEDLSYMDLPDPVTTSGEYVLKDGSIISREDYDAKEIICAKTIVHEQTNTTTYYILCSGNRMFDPTATYRTRDQWKFRKVVNSTFETYLKFLQQHYKSLLTQAERCL